MKIKNTGPDTIFALIVTLTSVSTHYFAYRFLLLNRSIISMTDNRFFDSVFFLSGSLGCTILLPLTRREIQRTFLFIFKAFCIGMGGVALSNSFSFELFLCTGLIFEITSRYRFHWGTVYLVGLISLIVFNTSMYGTFGTKFALMNAAIEGERLFLCVFAYCMGLFFTHLTSMNRRNDNSVKQLTETIGKLTQANIDYQEYVIHVAERSSEEERRRITRDLHDVVGMAFTNTIGMMNAVLKQPLQTEDEREELYAWILDTAQTGLKNTRTILYHLRNITETRTSTITMISRLIDAFSQATGTNVLIEWGNIPFQFNPAVSDTCIHLVQESLVNSFRHGKASEVRVHFRVEDNCLHIRITDNGRGGTTTQSGIGHTGMRERLAKNQGTFDFISNSSGYTVLAELPLNGNTGG